MANEPSVTDGLKAALADIQQPSLPDEFYPAPGVLILLALTLLALYWLGRKWFRHYQQNGARRLAQQALMQISADTPGAANAVLQTLKQYLQTKKPGHPALAYNSADFVAFLQQSAAISVSVANLDGLLYGPVPNQQQVHDWLQFAQQWLAQHRELSLHV